MKWLCKIVGHNWYAKTLDALIPPYWGHKAFERGLLERDPREEWLDKLNSPCTRCGKRPMD